MDTNPVTTFTRRAETVQDLFQPIGASPAVAADLFDADQRITDKLQELDGKLKAPSPEDLAAAGIAYASGKGTSKITAALQAPNVTGPRYQTIRKAAERELTRKADRAEWAVSRLIEDMAQDVENYMSATASAATETLRALPDYALDAIRAGRQRANNIDSLVDGRTTSTADIRLMRDCANAWAGLWRDGNAQGLNRMFAALATGDTSPHAGVALNEGAHSRWALWFGAKGMAALACRYKPETIILDGVAEFSPLSDPFGEDAEVYQHRVAAAGGVQALCAGRRDIMAATMRQNEPLLSAPAAARKSARGYSLLQRVGLGDPAKALDEYLREFPAYASDVEAEDQDAADTTPVSA